MKYSSFEMPEIRRSERLDNMSVKIISVEPDSPAHEVGICSGNRLVEINGQLVSDPLDCQFLLHDEQVQIRVRDSRGREGYHCFQKAYGDDLGLRLSPIRPRTCRNRCIFCFVDQLPRGMRQSLYIKDEDYRLSFLQGNYITLTALKEDDLQRILQQRLSPLYISVHSTDEQVRQLMLGRKDIPGIIETISRLAIGRIQMHCQVVICPGINDDSKLTQTVFDLATFFPAVQSVAIVPVGLTGHRRGLYPLRSVDRPLARALVGQIEDWQRKFRHGMNQAFVYPADELILLAGRSIPDEQYYDDFSQLENGVGMTRHFLDILERRQRTWPHELSSPKILTIVTGQMAAPVLRRKFTARLSRINGLAVHLRAVPNRFFGGGVTVSGLLTGQDIIRFFGDHPASGTLILPPNCLNEDGLFLDDLSPKDVQDRIGIPVRISDRNDPLKTLEEIWS